MVLLFQNTLLVITEMVTRSFLGVCTLIYIQTDPIIDIQSLVSVAASTFVCPWKIYTNLLTTSITFLALIDVKAASVVVIWDKPFSTLTVKPVENFRPFFNVDIVVESLNAD